jgi:hypothetical protein
MNQTAVPQYLMKTLNAMRFRRRAGEWELQPHAESAQAPSTELVTGFLKCFPWTSLQSLKVHTPAGERDVSPQSVVSDQDLTDDFGFEAELTMELHVLDADGRLGRSSVPGAGQLQFDREPAIMTFTVWPNLFTDTIRLRDADDDSRSSFADWAEAAHRNRGQLAGSLRCWTAELGGSIISADSELIDGVDTEGVKDSAAAR